MHGNAAIAGNGQCTALMFRDNYDWLRYSANSLYPTVQGVSKSGQSVV